jgi:methylmalonyl-CoA mutase cobalamin-binding subunit
MPNRGRSIERIPELQELARAAGRGPIPVSFYPKAEGSEIERLAAAGVDRCIYYVPPDGRDEALAKLEELGRMIRPYVESEVTSKA